jgi:hypothetical protein
LEKASAGGSSGWEGIVQDQKDSGVSGVRPFSLEDNAPEHEMGLEIKG